MNMQNIGAVALCASLCLAGGNAKAAGPAAAPPESRHAPPGSIDCSADYGGTAATCEPIPCNALYRSFLGTWSGQFWSYVQARSSAARSTYRPYHELVTYSAADCLRNVETGDRFIVGHQTESYPAFDGLPAKTATNLLISGQKADGRAYLRITLGHHAYDYRLRYENRAAKLAVWELDLPAAKGQPQMTFTTIDGRSFSGEGRTRTVTITLAVGPPARPYWQGVIAYGSHTRADVQAHAIAPATSNSAPRANPPS
jgi:hypothetical protein